MGYLGRMKSARWSLAEPIESERIKELSEAINVSAPVAEILLQRGISSFEEAREFFVPQLSGLHDPFLMKDMDKAVNRLIEAIAREEKILVYGDYDVDGTTAVAVMYSFISSFYDKADYYIPDRHSEGYGISMQGVEFAAENDFKLVIALDCGIKANEKVEYASRLGVDFIICDHHLPGAQLPAAVAILDPKRPDCGYPFKELCGCGVGFKLIQAFCRHQGWAGDYAYSYLDLVAVSIAADIVPVTGENRILSHFGLHMLCSEKQRPGLKVLLEKSTLKRDVNINDLVFIVAPRINAAGRITSGREAVALLIEKDDAQAQLFSKKINDNNSLRKDLDQQITREALEMIESSETYRSGKSTVVYSETWHKGVVGIVASRLTETYYRPTIVLTRSGEKATGSARSVTGYDVYSAIEACSGLLEQFGGHKYAAGLSLPVENISRFRELFEQTVASTITDEQLQPELKIDIALDFKDITPSFFNVLKRMGPFGPDNMQPVFYTENVFDTGYARVVAEKHLKCQFYQDNEPGARFDAIAFKQAGCLEVLKSKKPLKIAYSIEENVWNDNVSLQLVIRDIRLMND